MGGVTLAAEAMPWSINGVATLILVAAASLGALGVLAALIVRGFWAKAGEPVVKGMFRTWLSSPEVNKERIELMKTVIENEIRRDDGLIHKEIKVKTDALHDAVLRALAELRDQVSHDVTLKGEILERLSRIEGSVQVLTQRTSDLPGPPPLPARYPTGSHSAIAPKFTGGSADGSGKYKPIK